MNCVKNTADRLQSTTEHDYMLQIQEMSLIPPTAGAKINFLWIVTTFKYSKYLNIILQLQIGALKYMGFQIAFCIWGKSIGHICLSIYVPQMKKYSVVFLSFN